MNHPFLSTKNSKQILLKRINIACAIFIPLIGFLYGVAQAWNTGGIDIFYLLHTLVFYVLTGLGITIGYHRLFTHSSFKTTQKIRLLLAVLGSAAVLGRITAWAGHEFDRHKKGDRPESPYSPWRFGTGFWNLLKGFFHAHCLWQFSLPESHKGKGYERLSSDRVVQFVDRTYYLWIFLGVALPAAFGYIYDGLHGAWTAFIWGGLVRIFLLQQAMWAINSYCHLWGKKTFKTESQARDCFWLTFLTFGDSLKSGHYRFPSSYRHGFDTSFDFSYLVIDFMCKHGLAWDFNLPNRDKVDESRVRPIVTV